MVRCERLAALLVLVGCNGHYPVVEPYLTEGSSGHGSESEAQDTSGGSGGSGESSSGSAGGGQEGSSEGAAGTSSEDSTEAGSDGEAESDDASPSTSEEPPGYCGDGRVDPDDGEECDDGEPVTAKCVYCQRVRIIFLTSKLLQGGKINGLMGADAYCRSLALKAKEELPDSPIVEPMNFKALLSTSLESIERHHIGRGPYRLVNGLQVSRSFVELFTEPLENPINVTERSETLHASVWTGTAIDGTQYPGIDFCGDWTDLKGTANFGNSDYVDANWIHLDIDLNPDDDCYSELPIYCVEQE